MNMDADLLDKYRKGTCSKEELEFLQAYFQRKETPALDQVLLEEWQALESAPSTDTASVKAEIWQQLTADPKKPGRETPLFRLRWHHLSGIAAAVALLLLAGTFLQQPSNKINTATIEAINQETFPLSLQLEDGTEVWLKPGSRLVYPETFSPEERRVRLLGEARFEVTTDPDHPFIVETGQVLTRVLGTTFNVKAFPGRDAIEIALLEGKVKVDLQADTSLRQLASLAPGEALTFRKANGLYSKSAIISPGEYEWKNGIIEFQRAGIREVAETLEDWYGISITIPEGSSIESTLVHRINTQKLELEEILEGIALVAPYRFEKIRKNEYEVRLNPDQ
jgi:ferric-dicitrate binding protein FerR (iron transport regulator)